MHDDIHSWAVRHGVSASAAAELIMMITPYPSTVGPTGKSEASVQQKTRVLAFSMGNSLWRNNNGGATTDDGRVIRFGVGNDSSKINKKWKSGDLIGITRVMSTQIGQVFGVYTNIEMKRPGWRQVPSDARAKAQAACMNNVRALGGLAGFAQSTEDYKRIIGHAG